MRILFLFAICSFFSGYPFLKFERAKMPPVALRTLDGKTVNTADFKNDGKPIVIFVWETTCKPCIAEFNNVTDLYSSWQKETGVKVIAVSIDDSRNSSKVSPMVKARGWPFDFYLDVNSDFKRALNITYCPHTIVLDREGNIIWQKTGYTDGDEDFVYNVVQKATKGEAIKGQ